MSHYGLDAKTYRVVISATGLGDAGTGNGFIDHKKVAQYVAEGGTAPTSVGQSIAKERGNSRYETLIGTLSMASNVAITNQTATGGSAIADPTAFQFDVFLERGDDAIANEGLTGAAALKRLVARALLIARTDRTDYFDPTTSAAKGDNAPTLAARNADVVADVAVGALTTVLATAETAITVTAL
jgi:hypothetical protein